jgi:hypothetical protein
MLKPPAQVVMLHARNSERALENLNRITGLCFSRWPESLVTGARGWPAASEPPSQVACEAPVAVNQALP